MNAQMDHSLYAYSALPRRAPAPSEARLEGYVLLCLEHWHAQAPAEALKDPRFVGEFGSFTPDYRSWTQREYGLRVGVFRVIDALTQAGLRPAVAINAKLIERVPHLIEQLQDWGCEWVAHGLAANDMMHGRMSLEAQRAHIHEAIDTCTRLLGQRPQGWLSQDWGTTPETAALLAEAGIRYTLDWCNDDQPYRMQAQAVDQPPLIAVPLSAEWDDVQSQWLRQLTPRAHTALTLAAVDQLQGECARSARPAVFGLALHPWVCGMPSRIGALRELLVQLAARPGVHWTSPGEIAQRLTTLHPTSSP